MNARMRAEARLATLAQRQHGLIARRQALAAGLSPALIDRRCAAHRWQRCLPGVYRVVGAPRSFHQEALAAVLWAGDGAVASHTSAARLLRLEGAPADPTIHVLVAGAARGLRPTRILAGARHKPFGPRVVPHRTQVPLEPVDRLVVDGVPCVSAALTIIQCAALTPGEALDVMFECARRRRLVSAAHLQRRADSWSGSGFAGCGAVRELLAMQLPGGPSEYRLEVKAKRLIAHSDLPRPQRQHWVHIDRDWFRLDLAWTDRQVAAECEGFEFHGNRRRWKHDRRRLALLEAAGWRVVLLTWDDVVHEPQRTLVRLAGALTTHATPPSP